MIAVRDADLSLKNVVGISLRRHANRIVTFQAQYQIFGGQKGYHIRLPRIQFLLQAKFWKRDMGLQGRFIVDLERELGVPLFDYTGCILFA